MNSILSKHSHQIKGFLFHSFFLELTASYVHQLEKNTVHYHMINYIYSMLDQNPLHKVPMVHRMLQLHPPQNKKSS